MTFRFLFKTATIAENCATAIAVIGCICLRYLPDHLSHNQYKAMHVVIGGIAISIVLASFLGMLSLIFLNVMKRNSDQVVAGEAKWARWSMLATIFVILALVVLPAIHS